MRKKRRKKRSFGRILTILIICGLGYTAFIAKNQGILSLEKIQQFADTLSKPKNEARNSNLNSPNINTSYKGYGVQLLSTQALSQAKNIMNDFARDGYSAFILLSKENEVTWYKVRLGPYTYETEAKAIQAHIIRRYPKSPYVKSSLVAYKSE